MEIGRYSSEYEQNQVSGKVKATVSAIPITATVKGILPLADGKFELYGGAGLGLYIATMETEGGVLSSGSYDANALGFHVVGGADYNLSKNIAIGGEAKWIAVEPDFNAGGSGKMGGGVVNVGVKYKI